MIGDLIRTKRKHFWLLWNIADQKSLLKVIVLRSQRERNLFILEPCTLRFSHVLFVFEDMLVLFHESTLVKFCIIHIESLSEIGVATLIPSIGATIRIFRISFNFFALS